MQLSSDASTRTLVLEHLRLFGNLTWVLLSGALNNDGVGENCEFAYIYTVFGKKHPLTFSFISP